MRIIKLNCYIIVLLLTMAGCSKDFLNKAPLDSITSHDFWKTTNDLKLFVNQFYTSLNTSMSSRLEDKFARDILSDDLSGNTANGRLRGITTVPGSGSWGLGSIRALNIFLTSYHTVTNPFEEYKAYVGEAHFFRAFFYFNLVKAYGDVPYVNKPLETNSEELYMPRTPRNQVVDSIVVDLDKAISYLPSGRQEGGTRLNKEVALLLKSRVCLYEGTWEKYHANDDFAVANAQPEKYLTLAAQAAQEAMNFGTYGIYTTGTPDWDYFDLFSRTDYSSSPEALLWEKFDVELGKAHALQFTIGAGNGGGIGLSKSFVDSYLCIDGKPIYAEDGSPNALYEGDETLAQTAANRDPRFKQTIFTPGFPIEIKGDDTTFFVRSTVNSAANLRCPTGYQLNKFLNFDPAHHATLETLSIGYTAWITFRYAEVLLNYAEAKAELGTLTQDDLDASINLLRDRVGMPPLTLSDIAVDPNWDFPDLSPVINEVRRERRVELICEAFRWDDIARWAAADEVIVGKRPMGAKFNLVDYPGFNPVSFQLTDGYFDPLKPQVPDGYGFKIDRDYLSPISIQERTLNPAIEQNPGWE